MGAKCIDCSALSVAANLVSACGHSEETSAEALALCQKASGGVETTAEKRDLGHRFGMLQRQHLLMGIPLGDGIEPQFPAIVGHERQQTDQGRSRPSPALDALDGHA